MAKRKETIQIEHALEDMCREKRIYGCSEVTIGFPKDGHGDEIVDFLTIDSKDIIRCYEIKVTLADLKSDAKKSFYGHYNYLAITPELYKELTAKGIDLEAYGIPSWCGIITSEPEIKTIRKAKSCDIPYVAEEMLKSSLIRSLFYKMDALQTYMRGDISDYRAADKAKIREQAKEIERLKAETASYRTDHFYMRQVINRYAGHRVGNDELDAAMEEAEKELTGRT